MLVVANGIVVSSLHLHQGENDSIHYTFIRNHDINVNVRICRWDQDNISKDMPRNKRVMYEVPFVTPRTANMYNGSIGSPDGSTANHLEALAIVVVLVGASVGAHARRGARPPNAATLTVMLRDSRARRSG
jgi:hypothetical protein